MKNRSRRVMLYHKPTSTLPVVHDPRLPMYRLGERSSTLPSPRLTANRLPGLPLLKLPISVPCVFGERLVAARSLG